MRRNHRWFLGAIALAISGIVLFERGAEAACDLIPQSQQAFRATLGTVNRPFASPGDVVEIDVRSELCDGASSGFAPGDVPGDYVVTVVFEPELGRRQAVVLSADCSGFTPAVRKACETSLGSGSNAECQTVNLANQPVGLGFAERMGRRRLTFRFPDTAQFVQDAFPGDPRTLAGPATIAVTRSSDPLPCAVGPGSCATEAGLVACIDRLFEADGSCEANTDPIFPSFTALPPPNAYQQSCFADTPPCALVDDATTRAMLQMTVDVDGNLLIPMSWRGVLANQPGEAIPRLLRGTLLSPVPIDIPSAAFLRSYTPEGASLPPLFEPQIDRDASSADVITLFGSADSPTSVLRIARQGGECAGGAPNEWCATNRDCDGRDCIVVCMGDGGDEGKTCSKPSDCGAPGRCGEIYDGKALKSRAAKGPALAIARLGDGGICQASHEGCEAQCSASEPCVAYALEANLAVALDTLTSTSDEVLAVTVRESVVVKDLNGDGDLFDTVALVHDRVTGELIPLGAPAGRASDGVVRPDCGITSSSIEGRAVLRVRQPPFELPAFDTEGTVAAFLESEQGEKYCDLNDDGDRSDAILRVADVALGDLTAGITPARAVDGSPVIDGRAVLVSEGRVFFRSSEAAMATQQIVGVSVKADGKTGDADSGTNPSRAHAKVSGSGQCVAFDSRATNLDPVLIDNNGQRDIYLRELPSGPTELVSVTFAGGIANGESTHPAVSEDCRYVVFISDASNLLPPGEDTNGVYDVFVRDRCRSNGVPVPSCTSITRRVNLSTADEQADGLSDPDPAISADGRFIAFHSTATNLLGPGADGNGFADVFVRDRDTDEDGIYDEPGAVATTRVSVATGGSQAIGGESTEPSISADGRYVGFRSSADNLSPLTTDLNPYVHDRETGTTSVINVSIDGSAPYGGSCPTMSPDGRYVAFLSYATNMVNEADGGSDADVFVRDLLLGVTQRVSVRTGGGEAPGLGAGAPMPCPAISRNARHVLFTNSKIDDVPGPAAGTIGFVHDRMTQATDRVAVGPGAAGSESSAKSISGDGRVIVFASDASDLLPPGDDQNGQTDVFARIAVDGGPFDVDDLLFDDDALDDTVLEVFDTATSTITTLCPADAVSVAGGKALFLRPEATSGMGSVACPVGPLNGDGDTDDLVLHFWDGASVHNEGLAATAVAMSETVTAPVVTTMAALVSEAGEGANLNHDGGGPTDADFDDQVLHVRTTATGQWTNVGQAADTVRVCGKVVVFITPEAAQNQVLNDDGSMDDRVLQIYDPASDTLVHVGQAAEDFVCNESLVAFRTPEAAQGVNLNGPDDADMNDHVLQVFDLEPACLVETPAATCRYNSGYAARACQLEACDPRVPYRVVGKTVKFLTFECDQGGSPADPVCAGGPRGRDLNADGSADDLILQLLDRDAEIVLPLVSVAPSVEQDPFAGTGEQPIGDDPSPDAGGGVVVVASGRCIEEFTTRTCSDAADCLAGEHCRIGSCADDHRPCRSGAECENGVACDGRYCVIDHRPCQSDADCPSGATCEPAERSTPASPDSDGDGVPDHVDNCPFVANANPSDNQKDDDGDGIGNACDVATCGDGIRQYGEQCEVGDDSQCDGPCGLPPGSRSCTCTCANTLDSGSVVVTARRNAGKLVATMVIDLGEEYGPTGAAPPLPTPVPKPVRVRLSDADPDAIADQSVGVLPLFRDKGRTRTWRYKTRGLGIQEVELKRIDPAQPSVYRLKIKAKKWFSSAAADQPAASTKLSVSIGTQCFSHAVTKKTD